MGPLVTRDKQDFIELVLFGNGLRHDEMPQMDRIKAPAQNSDTLRHSKIMAETICTVNEFELEVLGFFTV